MKKSFLQAAALVLIIFFPGCNSISYNIETGEGYSNLFKRSDGWTGGDIASSIPVSDSLVFWLFGDSWIGPVVENRHFNSTMINNVVAVQSSKKPDPDKIKFYYRTEAEKAGPLIVPPDNRGWFWLTGGGIMTDQGLALIAAQIEKVEGDSTVWGFRGVANYLILVKNPSEDPLTWKMDFKKIPFYETKADGSEKSFGSLQLRENGFIYIYGTELSKPEFDRFMMVARVQEKNLSDFGKWEFYGNGQWKSDFQEAERLCNHFGAEFSVSWQPYLKRYITIYTEMGLSDKIIMRTSRNPEGPWSEQKIVYITPEASQDSTFFCYAARGHQELSEKDEILVSYICNSSDFWKMAANADIYRPQFFRLKFSR
jgi:hypothetical protein